jgi:hypothetical protein
MRKLILSALLTVSALAITVATAFAGPIGPTP